MVKRLFFAVPWGCLRFVIVVFPKHTHLLFWMGLACIVFGQHGSILKLCSHLGAAEYTVGIHKET